MSIDLSLDDDQRAIVAAVERFCADHCPAEALKGSDGGFSLARWRAFAELGFLALCTEEGGGGPVELVALMEALGRAAFPGPLIDHVLASQLLQGEELAQLVSGEAIASLGSGDMWPFAPVARFFFECEGDRVYRAYPDAEVQPVQTLGAEPWGTLTVRRGSLMERGPRALCLSQLARAAYATAAARALLVQTAEHVRTREQFGRAIGTFQAVAHPLADCSIALGSAAALARIAAGRMGDDFEQVASARPGVSVALASATEASLRTSYACHQALGAIGITVEGPAFHLTRKLRQMASRIPDVASERRRVLESLGV